MTPVSSTVDTIQQSVYFVEKNEKKDLLLYLLKDKSIESVLIFTRTKYGADKLAKILNKNSVVAEAIQTILRREAYPHPYEALKALTRTNQAITEGAIKEFIETLNVSEDIKKELRVITPHNYTGI